MSETNPNGEWWHLGPNDPPEDLSCEEAVYNREREWLERDHLGEIALIYKDKLIGVFPDVDEALIEGYKRLGMVKMVCWEIRPPEPEWISFVDVNHPSFRRIEEDSEKNRGKIRGNG